MQKQSIQAERISRNNIETIMAYRDVFGRPLGELLQMDCRNASDPYILSKDLERFIKDLHRHQFIHDMDVETWSEEAVKYENDPGLLKEASLVDLINLFSYHIKKIEIDEDHIFDFISSSVIRFALNRLRSIHREKFS